MIRSKEIYEIVWEVMSIMKVLKDSESMDSRVKMIKDLNLETIALWACLG
jgi:spore germination protein YaaH